jgi:superfamily II DNA helicase RecQ
MSDNIKILTQLNLPVCMFPSCHFAVKEDYLASHLKDAHSVSQEVAISTVVEVLRAIGSVEQTAAEKEDAVKYFNPRNTGIDGNEALPPLPFLRVAEGRRCLFCPYIAISADTLFKHTQAKHGQEAMTTGAAEMFHSSRKLTVQSIFGGSKKRWFEVTDTAEEVVESDSSPVRFMKDFHGASGLEHISEDASCMNAFLATVRFDSVLQEHSLSISDSWDMVHGSIVDDQLSDMFLKQCITKYFAGTFHACKRNPFLTAHSVQGSRLRVCLERNTLNRYESEAVLLLQFARNCLKQEKSFVPVRVSKILDTLGNVAQDVDESVMRSLHALMCALFLDVVENRTGDVGLIGIYIACASIVGGPSKELLRFAEASEISPVLAALKYCVRIIAVSEVVGLGESKSSEESWKLIESRTADTRVDTGATYTAYLSHLAHTIMPSESARCRFRICPRHKKCGYIDGVEISLSQLGDAVRAIQQRATHCLEKKLLNEMEWGAQFCDEASGLDDGLQNSARGFWFGNHPANASFVSKWAMMLWKHRASDFWSEEDGKIDVAACNEFLNGCEEMMQLIFALVQLTAGSPSRASECSGLRVMNDAAASRNIYLCDGQIVITSFYSKTRSLNDGLSKPIARFPDSVTQAHILAYLLIVRPLEYCIVKALQHHSCESAAIEDQRFFLFARRGEVVSSKVLCAWFKSSLTEIGIENVGMSQYRQYQTGMLKNFDIVRTGREELPTFAQAGHSAETAHRLYGVSDADFRHLTGTELEAYRIASQRWHEELGLEHGPASVGGSPGMKTLGSAVLPTASGSTDPFSSSGGSLASHLIESLERMEALLSGLVSQKRKGECVSEYDGEYELEGRSKRKKIVFSGVHLEDEARSVAEEMKAALSLFIGAADGEKKEFRSAGQCEAIVMSRLRQTDGLIVLPTGGGKSLTFMLPCYVETNTVTVVIVPLVALQHDMLARCTRAGIDAVLWRDRERVGVRIVIASVEHVETEEYARYIRAVSGDGKLARIVIDEAHLVFMWCDFREKMKSLGMSIRPAGVHVPLLMLTATAPPQLVPRITSMCGAGLVKVIRANASRPNIRYSCVRVHAGNSAVELNMAVARKVTEIVDSYRAASKSDRVVVYMLTRGEVEVLSSILGCDTKTSAYTYHAGMSQEERQRSQDGWSGSASDGEKFKVMIATSAFGTGIDYPGIRAVVHVNGSRNLIEFYQESGRAGRDGRRAESIVLAATENPITFKDESEGEALHLKSWKGRSGMLDQQEFGNFRTYVTAESTCRRDIVEGFCQGDSLSTSCIQLRSRDDRAALCDYCERVIVDSMEESSTCPSTSQPRISSQASTHLEDKEARKSSESMYRAGEAVIVSASEAQSRRLHADAEVDALKRLALKIGNACAVCTVASGTEVRHGAAGFVTDLRRLPCRRGRCDRCSMRGHFWDSCTLNPKPKWNQGCTRCGISKHLGLNVHPDGQFGKPECGIQTLVSIALLSWTDEEKRKSMILSVPEITRLSSTLSFGAWLRSKETSDASDITTTGLAHLTAWIDSSYSSGNAQDTSRSITMKRS